MAAMDIDALIKRADRAEVKRQSFARLMQDVFAYAMPERDSWNAYGYGQQRNVQVYDSAATVSAARCANRLQQVLFPIGQRWSDLVLPPELATAASASQVQQDLQAATALMFRHIHASNFDMVVNEFCQDLLAGVGCMLIEDGRLGTRRTRGPRLRCQAIPAGMVAYDEGPFGVVEGVFFRQRLPARLVARTYPDAKELPDGIARLEREDPDAPVELLQTTYYDAEEDTYRLEALHLADKARFLQRKHRTMPWVITRWSKAPGESHGRGPLVQALPDIRTANKLMELMLKSGSIAVGGVWTARDDGVLNPANIRIAPGTVIPVQSNGAGPYGPSLKALEFPGSFQISEILMDRISTRIRQTLFDDPLPPEVQRGLTATEVVERVRRFQADTGAFGRLMADAVTPMVHRFLDILDQAGEFAAPEFAGLMDLLRDDAIRVRPTSPLALAQDQADSQAVWAFASNAASLGEFGMRMLAAGVDPDRAGPWVAERSGVPQALIPSVDQTKRDQDSAREAQVQSEVLGSPVVAQMAGALAGAAARPEGAPPA